MFIFLILGVVLVVVQYFLFFKEDKHFKKSAYECGFLTSTKSSSQISLQYYVILILFMIFDLEVILVLPMLMSFSWVLYFLLFFMIISLLFEWKVNQTSWEV